MVQCTTVRGGLWAAPVEVPYTLTLGRSRVCFLSLASTPQLSTLPGINGASGESAVAPVQTAELVGVGASASVGSAAGTVHPAYAGKRRATVGIDM